MYSPLDKMPEIPIPPHKGAFGVVRKYHTHEGVDLYCEEGSIVYSISEGVVCSIDWFTGEYASSPWWGNTQSICIKHSFGYLFYGEITVSSQLSVGDKVIEGTVLGRVIPVLKQDKGNGMSMLHLEMYSHFPGSIPLLWTDKKPEYLISPQDILLSLVK